MPSLNSRQFSQPEFGGMPEPSPARRDEAAYDPGPDYKRGQVGVGQRQMNFDRPDIDLEVGTGGLVGVDRDTDPGWDPEAWVIGGYNRQMSPGGTTTQKWENAPVRTFGPDTEIRTNQVQAEAYGNEVDVIPSRVSELRSEEFFLRDPEDYVPENADEDPEVRPWVARVGEKNYLLEGHHRAVAQRTRGTGEFDAHVIEADDWDEMIFGKFGGFPPMRGRR